MKLEVRTVPVKPVRAPKTFHLELNDEEAAPLHQIVGNCGGPVNGPRKLTDAIYYAPDKHINRALQNRFRQAVKIESGVINIREPKK